MKKWIAVAAMALLVGSSLVWNATALDSSTEIVSDYSGADIASSLLEEAQKDSMGKTVFVMFHHPSCEDCARLTSLFQEARAKAKLDYSVLRVNVGTMRECARAFQRTASIPETFIVRERRITGSWKGAHKSAEELVKLLDTIDQTPLPK